MQKRIIGRIDKIDFPAFKLEDIEAKIDTGANRSTIHFSRIEVHETEGA